MKVAVLFSGGKDSSLAALLLEPFFDEIELVGESLALREVDLRREADNAESFAGV